MNRIRSRPLIRMVILQIVMVLLTQNPAFSEQVSVEEIDTLVSIEQAFRLVKENNPELKVRLSDIKAKKALFKQAGVLINPEIAVEVENVFGSGDLPGFDSAELSLMVGQTIELGGKRKTRKSAAQIEYEITKLAADIVEIELAGKLKQLWIDILVLQEKHSYLKENEMLDQEMVQVISKKVKIGNTSPIEKTKAEISLERAKLDLRAGEIALANQIRKLGLLWGNNDIKLSKIDSSLKFPEKPRKIRFYTEQKNNNLQLKLMQQVLALKSNEVRIEKSMGSPDLGIEGGLKHDNGSRNLSFQGGVSIPLMVFDQNKGNIDSATFVEQQMETENEKINNELDVQIHTAHSHLQLAYQKVIQLKQVILPMATSSFEGVNAGYLKGKFGFLDVIDAKRTLFETKNQTIDAIAEYYSHLIELDQLVGNVQLNLFERTEQ